MNLPSEGRRVVSANPGAGNGLSVLHVWDDFRPGQFVDAHAALHEDGRVRSFLAAARGIDVDSHPYPASAFLTQVDLHSSHDSSILSRLRRRIARPFIWSRFNAFLSAQIRAYNPDIIHAHFGTTAARILPALSGHDIPAVALFYGVDASASLRDPAWSRPYHKMFRRYQRFFVLSEAVRDRLARHGCPAERIRTWNLPAGVESYPFNPKPPHDPVRFIIGARFTGKKGYRFLLPAFKKLLDSGRRAELTAVGYGPERSTIERLALTLGIHKAVQIIATDLCPDFTTLYRKLLAEHDIFVLPSTTAANGDDEGGPALTLVYAQAAGLPIICTPFVGAEISMKDRVTGLFCAPDDVESLYSKMTMMMDHPEAWRGYSEAGRAAAVTAFSRTGQINTLIGLYRELAEERKRQ